MTTTSALEHVSLVTGLHHIGPFESYRKVKSDTPFREDQARLPCPKFHHVQEDILYAEAAKAGFA